MIEKRTFSISELAQEFDVTTRSIRFYPRSFINTPNSHPIPQSECLPCSNMIGILIKVPGFTSGPINYLHESLNI